MDDRRRCLSRGADPASDSLTGPWPPQTQNKIGVYNSDVIDRADLLDTAADESTPIDFVVIKDTDHAPGRQDAVSCFDGLEHVACVPATPYEHDWG